MNVKMLLAMISQITPGWPLLLVTPLCLWHLGPYLSGSLLSQGVSIAVSSMFWVDLWLNLFDLIQANGRSVLAYISTIKRETFTTKAAFSLVL